MNLVIPKYLRISLLILVVILVGGFSYLVLRNSGEISNNEGSSGNQVIDEPAEVTREKLSPVLIYYESKNISAKGPDGSSRGFPYYRLFMYDPNEKVLKTLFDEYGSIKSYLYNFYLLDSDNLVVAYEDFVSKLNLTTKQETKLASYKRNEGSGQIIFNKDKTKIAYTDNIDSSVANSGELVIKSLLADGSEQRVPFKDLSGREAPTNFFVPLAFSEDEQSVYFSVAVGEVPTDILQLRITDKKLEKLPFKNLQVNYLPNSDLFVFSSVFNGVDLCNDMTQKASNTIEVYKNSAVQFTSTQQATNHIGFYSGNVFSPDGKELLYTSYPALGSFSGTDEQRLAKCVEIFKQRSYNILNISQKQVRQITDPMSQLRSWFPSLADIEVGFQYDNNGSKYLRSVKVAGKEIVEGFTETTPEVVLEVVEARFQDLPSLIIRP